MEHQSHSKRTGQCNGRYRYAQETQAAHHQGQREPDQGDAQLQVDRRYQRQDPQQTGGPIQPRYRCNALCHIQ